MKPIIPVLGLKSLTDDRLIDYSQDKIDRITGNANFPAPDPTTADVQTATDVFKKSVVKAIDGSHADVADKDQKREDLEDLLTVLAFNCAAAVKGNVPKFLTSGFAVKKRGTVSSGLEAPGSFKLTSGENDGELKAVWKRVKNNHGYELRWSYDNVSADAMLNTVPASRTRLTISGLTSGKKVYAYVRAIAARNKGGDWSDVSSKTVP